MRYCIVKNSWGGDWGDGGFIYMRKDAGNRCHVADHCVQLLEYLDDKQNLENAFNEFKYEFYKLYESSEEDRRKEQIFRDNMLRVYGHNLKALDGTYSYTLRVSRFADLTPQEFRQNHTNCTFVMNRPIAYYKSNSASVDSHTGDKSWSVDWRDQGGSCGSCTLFAMAALVESYWARSGHGVTTLSTQQMLDCYRNASCEGKGVCDRDRESKRVATIGEVSVNYPESQDSLMSLVRDNGPAFVVVHVGIDWRIYGQGVLTHQCEGERVGGAYSHAVLVVGYGYDKELDRHYWILKNSWGDTWGEGGYMRLHRNTITKCPLFQFSYQLPYNTGQSPGSTLTAFIYMRKDAGNRCHVADHCVQLLEYLDDKQNLENAFKEFKYEFSISYKSSEVDRQREHIFRDNLLRVYGHNLKALDGKYSYTLRVSGFADLTPEEFRKTHTNCTFVMNRPIAYYKSNSASDDSHTDDKSWSVDWRDQGENCGSCSLFAMAALVESYWARSGHGVTTLSTQQMLDCYPMVTYEKGVNMTGTCDREREAKPVVTIGEQREDYPRNENTFMSLVRDNGPAVVVGIFDGPCDGDINHAVLVVGYGYDKPSDMRYWIVKNSWGRDWGDGGFIYIRKDAGNRCHVADHCVQLLVYYYLPDQFY
ncbi:unnamed protein product [Oppiella nova]|uniref:Uncharacterized protein n=1 Tax=Oppiella nova TaxID=334625 RepID=A0A7R9M422_9ACAR|nr:unnamed protein product [Oppiella nova]CAG2170165.1 unnamed protein product [Oppiella nova]